jgi:hypothetical protein
MRRVTEFGTVRMLLRQNEEIKEKPEELKAMNAERDELADETDTEEERRGGGGGRGEEKRETGRDHE